MPKLSDDQRAALEAMGLRGRVLDLYRPSPPQAANDDEAGVFRFAGVIAPDGYAWGDSVSAAAVSAWLADQSGDIQVLLNSPGGSYFEGVEIANHFRQYSGGAVTMRVMGMAASAASLVAMMGRRIEMMPGALLMIHRAWTLAIGDANDLEAECDFLRKLDGEAAGIYARRTGGDREDMLAKMDAETWMTPAEAVAAGFADAAVDGDEPEDDDEPDMSAVLAAMNAVAESHRRADLLIAQRIRMSTVAAVCG